MTTNEQVQAAALLPCPFCKSRCVTATHNEDGWPVVRCDDCGAQGPCTDRSIDEAGNLWNSRATPADPALDPATDTQRLDWLSNNPAMEISCSWEEEDGPWQVHAVLGGRNDREWHKRGQGSTPREAIDVAIRALASGERT